MCVEGPKFSMIKQIFAYTPETRSDSTHLMETFIKVIGPEYFIKI